MVPWREERAISPLVGGVLMLAIVVTLAVTVGVMVIDFGGQLEQPPPLVADEQSVQVDIGGNETDHTLQFAHRGGERIDADDLTVVVSAGGNTTRVPVSSLDDSALADAEWTAGERLTVSLEESMVCAPGTDAASVELQYSDGGDSYTLSSRSVPVERGQFVIDGARVRATTAYTANVKFVGTAWSSPSRDPPVNVTVHVDDSLVHGWRMVEDSPNVVGSYGVSRQDAETTIEIRAAGRQCGLYCQYGLTPPSWVRVSSTENSENVRVYRDGDTPPAFDSSGGQQSVAGYVDPYVDDGEITLDDNQAIYLFDFNSNSQDYQDVVVLVSFFTQRERTGVYESRATPTVLCPADTRSASPNGGGGNGGNGGGNGN